MSLLYTPKKMYGFFLLLSVSLFFLACGETQERTVNSHRETPFRVSRAFSSSLVPISSRIALEFSEKVDSATLSTENIFIKDGNGTLLEADISLDEQNQSKVIILPYKYFKALTPYELVVKKDGVSDLEGRTLQENFYYRFITGSAPALLNDFNISTTKPQDDALNVDISSAMTLEFNRFIAEQKSSDLQSLLQLKDATNQVVVGEVKLSNAMLSFLPAQPLKELSSYTLELKKPLLDIYSNLYDTATQQSSWVFQTADKVNSYTKEGFAELNTSTFTSTPLFVRTLKNSAQNSELVVATSNTLQLYRVEYATMPQKPKLSLVATLPIEYQLTAIESFQEKFLLVGSADKGLYTYTLEGDSLQEQSHISLNESINSVAVFQNRAYSVGVKDGLRLYDLDLGSGVATLTKSLRVPKSIMVDVVGDTDKIFVADYNGSVFIYDNTLTLLKTVALKASLKAIALDSLSSQLLLFEGIGRVEKMDLSGTLVSGFFVDLPHTMNRLNSAKNSDGTLNSLLLCDGAGYVGVVDRSFESGAFVATGNCISSSYLSGYTTPLEFLALLSSQGELTLKNMNSDTKGPVVLNDNLGEALLSSDATISFDIEDNYLDTQQIKKENFILKNSKTNQAVDYTLSLSLKSDTLVGCTIEPTTPFTNNSSYEFSVKSSLKDMLGNSLTGGDYVRKFQVKNPQLSLSGPATIDEGLAGTYKIALDRKAKSDLSVGLQLTYIDANSSDIIAPSSTYIIPAGSQSVSFDIATIDNSYENRDRNYSVSLVDISSGGGFSQIDTNTTAVVTSIVNNDTASVSTITTNLSATEGATITHDVTMSTTATFEKVYSYAMPDPNQSDTATYGSDYSAPTVSSNVTIDTANKTISVPANVSSFSFIVTTIDDASVESSETYSFTIENSAAQGTINDNDVAATTTTTTTDQLTLQ